MIWGVSLRIIISWNIWIGQKWKRVRSNTVGMCIMVYDSKVWFGYCKTLLKSLLRHLPCYVAACIFLPVHLYLISFDSISHFQLYWSCLIFTFCGLAYLASDAFSGNRNSFGRSGENAVKHDSFGRSEIPSDFLPPHCPTISELCITMYNKSGKWHTQEGLHWTYLHKVFLSHRHVMHTDIFIWRMDLKFLP